MPRALHEGLRPGLPLLDYGELVDLVRMKKYGLCPIVDPTEIPVHPVVFGSPSVYTPEFANRVWEKVPASVILDIAAIEAKVGCPVPVSASDLGVLQVTERFGGVGELYKDFRIEANPAKKSIWLTPLRSVNAINLGLDTLHVRPCIRSNLNRSFISKAILDSYALPETAESNGGIITWYAHNIGSASLALLLILRNFAIQFNNIGLQMLGVK